jgi:hypothetical protein
MNDNLKRTRDHQKQRESLSMSLPGYDTAIHTASKILNLSQDDLDDIMSTADENSQVEFLIELFFFPTFYCLFFRHIQKMIVLIKMIRYDKKYRNYSLHRKNLLVNF